MQLSDYHGKVSKCTCTNSDPKCPMDCRRCFCRGFLAQCLSCRGTGQITERVAGAAEGNMKATCNICGGKGEHGVNKPKDWDALHPEEKTAEVAESVVA